MLETILGIILLIAAIFLVVAVLMQHGKSHKLSGTIAGGSETFFGKSKAATVDKTLNKLTTIVAVVFVVIVVIMYIVQPNADDLVQNPGIIYDSNLVSVDSSADTTAAEVSDTTVAPTEAETTAAPAEAETTEAAE